METERIISDFLNSRNEHPGGFAEIAQWMKDEHPAVFDDLIDRLTAAINQGGNSQTALALAGVFFSSSARVVLTDSRRISMVSTLHKLAPAKAGSARAPKTKKPKVSLEDRADQAIARAGLPIPVREFAFHPTRKWRFDRAWPSIKLAVEIDGAGRHNTVAGMANDNEKINEALIMGWIVLRFNAPGISATGKRGRGARKMPRETMESVLARAWKTISART